MKEIKAFALTDRGLIRPRNEDNFLLKIYDTMIVAAVADGMGGEAHGEIASQLTVETIAKNFDKKKTKLSPEKLVIDSLKRSHRKIRLKGESFDDSPKMGTTCTLAAITKARRNGSMRVHLGHIGDSRMYLVEHNDIRQMSTDHTMVQKLLEVGALKPDEVEHFVHKNVIYKSLGGAEDLLLDPVEAFDLPKGGILLICSDGFSNYIKPDEMLQILQAKTSLEEACHYMVDLANYRGGDDNITVILVEFGQFQRRKDIDLEQVPSWYSEHRESLEV
jgi:protein phosphatase